MLSNYVQEQPQLIVGKPMTGKTTRAIEELCDPIVLYANEMNVNHHIDNRLQFDFFINIVRKRKRFSKWFKPEEISDLETIKYYYGYSNEKARQVLHLLSTEQINELKNKVAKGGRK